MTTTERSDTGRGTRLSMGEVARLTGLPGETLRFYDRAGLLGDLPRTAGGHRVFDDAALGLLDVVMRLRRTGMPVADVRRFVELVRAGGDDGLQARLALLRSHRAEVAARLEELTADLTVIDWKIAAYTAVAAGQESPPPPPGWPDAHWRGPAIEVDGVKMTASDANESATAETRLAKLGLTGPAIGVGTWALGGTWRFDGRDAGWGAADDAVSVRALLAAVELGATVIDTAAAYGTGHSERVVGRALRELDAAVRERVVVATKFGLVFDEESRTGAGTDVRPGAIRAECDSSLRRLGVERIDYYQLHGGADGAGQAEEVVATLEELVAEGKVRLFGTSQHDLEVIEVFARSQHCAGLQTQANVFGWSEAVLEAGRQHCLPVLARSPLAMGLLTGSYRLDHRPQPGDVRLDTPWWTYFDDDAMAEWLVRLDAVRDLLTVGGRSLAQGSLGYLWAVDPALVPLPGCRTPEQAQDNIGALAFGPLPTETAAEVTSLLAGSPERH